MNVGFMKPTVDNDWDEVLEEPATESASKENLYAYMRRVSGNGEVQAQNTPANHGSGGGGRFTMRGMRWSARVSAARSSGNQSVERRVASADQHDEAREKLSSSFKLRSARSSTLTDTFERSVAPLISETHALYIYSHRTAVDTWSRRMNFQERDAMSALALQLDSWSFDIFAFERVACGTPLHMMMRLLFLKHGFYELFEFDIKMVDRFAKEVERLYPANPYHNSTHAADVVQACHVFLLQLQHRKLVLCESAANVFGRPMPSKSSDDYISSSFAEGTPARKGSLGNETADDADDEKEEEAPVTPEFDKLDRLAMLLAAAVHDIGHPGVNASFLKATGNSLCQQFPDPVLEQFHAATARPLIEALLVGELANVRAYVQPLVTQLVLSTSVENHTAFVDTLNQRMDTLANPSGASAVEHQQSFRSLSTLDSQRSSGCLLLTNKDAESMMMELIIKCADVSNCARELPTYKLWVTRITEEFTGQTELERHMGVPVTTFMAHFDPQMQLGFINNIAFPLFDVLARLCPEATLQRDYVLANYMFYQKGKDTSSPGVSRADAQAVSEDPTRQLLVQEESRESRSSHEKGKLTSEVLLRSASNIALASSALSRSSTASMKVRPLFSAKHGAGNKSASVIFTTPLNLDPLESMHSKSVDALRASLPGMVVEEEEQAGPAGKAAVESPESPLSCK